MGNVEITVWDVQHGNAIYVTTPNGKHLVFDLGIGDYSGHNERFSPLMALWNQGVRTIDFLMITHPHLDHIDDILNLDRFYVKVLHRPRHLDRNIILNGVRFGDRPKFDKYFALHDHYTGDITGTDTDTAEPANFGGLSFEFFSTPLLPQNNLNNHSIITILTYANIKIVIPGDNECASLDLLMQRSDFKNAIANCHILIAPHHGRESAYHTDFVSHANPLLTIISDGSICDTSANPKYSSMSRGWKVWKKGTSISNDRKLLTTNSDGEVYIRFGYENPNNFLEVSII